MKKFTTLMIAASLALAGAVMAQEPTPAESQAPTKKEAPGKKPKAEKPAAEKPTTTKAPKTESPAVKEPAAAESPAAPKIEKTRKVTPANAPETKTSTEMPATSATPAEKKKQSTETRKDKKSPAASTTASASASPATSPKTKAAAKTTASPAATTATTPAPTIATTPATTTASTTPAAAASTTPAAMTPAATAATTPATSAAPSVSQSTTTNTAAVKKPDPQKVQQIRQQHTSFRAEARPDRVPAVTFSANFQLPGSDRWQGPQYEVYRSYHPQRHDRGWYSSHHSRVELIAGGYYYFDNGYWYPAWGYDSGHEYYAYDAPIYVGKRSEPPDRVIADVQAALQEMGLYKGEVDGLVGPLTREALTAYQTENGMQVTAVIDEPTLDALGMG